MVQVMVAGMGQLMRAISAAGAFKNPTRSQQNTSWPCPLAVTQSRLDTSYRPAHSSLWGRVATGGPSAERMQVAARGAR